MGNKTITLLFRAGNRDIFEAMRDGRKKVETRAATKKFKDIKAGDTLVCVCGRQKFQKQVKRAKIFKTIQSLTRAYKPREINPNIRTAKELSAMYASFPGYEEKIKKFGLIALELK